MALGEFHRTSSGAAPAVFLLTALMAAVLTRIQLGLGRVERIAWWASNGRDVVNAASVIALSAALAWMGFPWPAAAIVAANLSALAALVELSLPPATGFSHPDALAVALAVAAALPVALVPGPLFRAVDEVARALVP